MFLADFHTHSTFSDGNLTIPEVVDHFGKRGFGAIAITDHLCESRTAIGKASTYLRYTLTPATFPLYNAILASEKERAWDQYKMVVIPGFELTKNSISNHRSAHLLALGVTEYISANADVLELARSIRKLGGLSVAAHPVWTGLVEKQTFHIWDRRIELEPEIDVWEAARGPNLLQAVARSALRKLANSDFHTLEDMSSWKTILDCERHPGAIFEAILEQRLRFTYYQDKGESPNGDFTTTHRSLEHGIRADGLGDVVSTVPL